MTDRDNRMLCERSFDYTTMTQLVQRDIPIPQYKKRYNEYGQEDIYGEYDANRMYRGYSSQGGSAPLRSLKKKKRKFTEANDEVTVLLIPNQQRGDGSPLPVVTDTTTTTSTLTTSTTTTTTIIDVDNDDDTESSEGELPPGYEAMHTRVNIEPEPPLLIPPMMSSNMPCLECVRRSARGEYRQHEEAIRMRETLRDIKKVLLRTRKTPEDTHHHLEWVKQILAQYEENNQSSLAPNPSLTYADMMNEKRLSNTKKQQRREPDENIDLEYKMRYDDTDCFYCTACDPECFSRIKHYAWEDHCRMSTHRNAKIEYQEELQRINAIKEGTT